MANVDALVPPRAALVVAVLAVSTSAVLVRWSDAPSLVKALYRVVFTAALLAPVALTRHRRAFAGLRRRDVGFAAASGLALAVHFGAWFESLNHTTIAASVTLVQTQPAFVAAGAWAVLDERVTPRTVVGIVVALAGAATMSIGDALVAGVGQAYGNALALVGAAAAGGYVLAGRSLRQRLPLLPYVLIVYLVCAAGLLAVVVRTGYPLFDYPSREWTLFLAMAVGPGLFGHTVVNWALAHLESSVVSVSLLGEPVGSTLLALVFLGEVPAVWTLIGGVVVLVGIVVTATPQ
ncbi:DMT family transporter [Salinirarus marinus]|uniref:DMT family transporter n=1 Tax=Salinirarus marinus TaxID=3068310 RepID=UPI003C6CB220